MSYTTRVLNWECSFSELKEAASKLLIKDTNVSKFKLAWIIDAKLKANEDLLKDYDARNRLRHEALDIDMDIYLG